jgi:hypothetical protein
MSCLLVFVVDPIDRTELIEIGLTAHGYALLIA